VPSLPARAVVSVDKSMLAGLIPPRTVRLDVTIRLVEIVTELPAPAKDEISALAPFLATVERFTKPEGMAPELSLLLSAVVIVEKSTPPETTSPSAAPFRSVPSLPARAVVIVDKSMLAGLMPPRTVRLDVTIKLV